MSFGSCSVGGGLRPGVGVLGSASCSLSRVGARARVGFGASVCAVARFPWFWGCLSSPHTGRPFLGSSLLCGSCCGPPHVSPFLWAARVCVRVFVRLCALWLGGLACARGVHLSWLPVALWCGLLGVELCGSFWPAAGGFSCRCCGWAGGGASRSCWDDLPVPGWLVFVGRWPGGRPTSMAGLT